jgi:sarcosine oxidase subunit beta
MKGLRAACEERGVALHYGAAVTRIERAGDRVSGIWRGEDFVAADATVIAAGGHSPAVAGLAGVELEGRPWRLEAFAIEPLRPVLGPALALDRTVYASDGAR